MQIKKPHLHGFISLEITLALIISVIVGFFVIQQQARAAKTELANLQADQLLQIKDALNSYVDLHRVRIAGNQPVPIDTNGDGVNDSSIPSAGAPEGTTINPTPQQLAGLALLPPQFNPTAVVNGGVYKTRLQVLPVGCNVADPSACRIEGYVYLDRPITNPDDNIAAGQFDGQIVGDILERIGGDGFASVIRGQNLKASGGNFQIALAASDLTTYPGMTTPAGLVGVRVGSFATRAPSNPIANVDFCPGNPARLWWPKGTNVMAAPLTNTSTQTEQNGCVSEGYSDIPVGYGTNPIDFDQPVIGQARIICSRDPSGTLAIIQYPAQSYCAEKNNNPPPGCICTGPPNNRPPCCSL